MSEKKKPTAQELLRQGYKQSSEQQKKKKEKNDNPIIELNETEKKLSATYWLSKYYQTKKKEQDE
ncbi:MAG: hypothetical protein VR72_15110 [Clostridiaceae bacterium BRH_c20a]|nr:MAG: hypothetical protein VR72_15110 [Clostridiaceae bacterium BRH_c20a]